MPRSLLKVILTAYTTEYRLTPYIYSVSNVEGKESGMGDEVKERRRHERATTLALIEMPRLASRIMSVYSRSAYSPDEGQRATEVFVLYQRAQHTLESEDHRRAG